MFVAFIPRATNIPYQPLLIKLIFSVLAHAEKQFFSKLVFLGLVELCYVEMRFAVVLCCVVLRCVVLYW